MKKYALICATLVALVWTTVAAATAPPQLTGSMSFVGSTFAVGDPITDGGSSYVGLENDRSGNCTGDSGTWILNGGTPLPVLCAHWVQHSRGFLAGSPKMRFTFQSPGGLYFVIRITDNTATDAGQDSYATGLTSSLQDAKNWVNTGAIGSGHSFSDWSLVTVTDGDFVVTP